MPHIRNWCISETPPKRRLCSRGNVGYQQIWSCSNFNFNLLWFCKAMRNKCSSALFRTLTAMEPNICCQRESNRKTVDFRYSFALTENSEWITFPFWVKRLSNFKFLSTQWKPQNNKFYHNLEHWLSRTEAANNCNRPRSFKLRRYYNQARQTH